MTTVTMSMMKDATTFDEAPTSLRTSYSNNRSVVVPLSEEDKVGRGSAADHDDGASPVVMTMEPLDLDHQPLDLDDEVQELLMVADHPAHPQEKYDDTEDVDHNHNIEIDEETMMILTTMNDDDHQDDNNNDNNTTVTASSTSTTPCGSLMRNPYADFDDTFFSTAAATTTTTGNRNRLPSLSESSSSSSSSSEEGDDTDDVPQEEEEEAEDEVAWIKNNTTIQWEADGSKELTIVNQLQLSFDNDDSEDRQEEDDRLLVLEEEEEQQPQSATRSSSGAEQLLRETSCPTSVLEDVLANEMKKLTFEEKERAAFDVHGFCNGLRNTGIAIAEATTLEEERLVALDKELAKLRKKNKDFHNNSNNNPLLQDKQYRLMFLRCEDDLDAKLAAQRIMMNLETKRKIFGQHTINRHLEECDLTHADKRVLDSYFCKIAPQRDAAGRLVLLHVPDRRPPGVTMMDCFRAKFYLMSNLARDPQVQRQGIVVVGLFTRIPNKSKREAMGGLKFMHRLKAGLPRKITAAHLCIDTSICNPDRNNTRLTRLFVASAQLAMRQSVRDRFRSHVALRETIHFQMKTYGIELQDDDWPVPVPVPTNNNNNNNNNAAIPPPQPPSLIPLSSGEMYASDTSYHSYSGSGYAVGGAGVDDSINNASSCTSLTTSSTTTEGGETPSSSSELAIAGGGGDGVVVTTPTDKDVLLGRGKHTRNHAGNINATNLVNAHRQEYSKAKKHEKTAIAERIVRIIQSQGGRFLIKQQETTTTTGGNNSSNNNKNKGSKGNGGVVGEVWVPVDNQTARNKISHLYRNTKKSFLFGASLKR